MRNLYYEDFEIDQKFTTRGRTVTEADVVTFAGLSGDYSPIHMDEEYAKASPFGTRIAQGFLGASIASGLITQLGLVEETAIALLEVTCRFTGAVRMGDTIHVRQIIKDKRETSKGGRGIVTFSVEIVNQNGEVVIAGDQKVMVRKRD